MQITPKDHILRKPDDYITVHECISKQKSTEISIVHAELNGPHAKRMNKKCTIVYILTTGKMDVELNEATHHLNAGDMFLIRPGQWFKLEGHNAKLTIVHTPAWDPGYEAIEEN